ncbi:Uma2 family endonuclease [Occultella aeris]|uniref:Putative restriction endonuclease domain-containing protein n=1 Tax=Occultella aeris TaxID=2761496 RepID=A0A7M4DLP0_9MICO|nr:Uma2 family endonuclease [Occultella aeris]VZO38212.1 hypothetical protein HALOF300_03057 [Occultella aeris]
MWTTPDRDVGNDDVGEMNVTAPRALAVEVLSPSIRRKDLVLKRSKYEDCGVQSYWIIDPRAPSLVALDLVDGGYVTSADVAGDERAVLHRPFVVDVVPADLVRPAP